MPDKPKRAAAWRRIVGPVVAVAILAASGAVAYALIATKEEARRFPQRSPAPVVALAPLATGAHLVQVTGYGAVRAAEEVSLRPQVSGMVAATAGALYPGGLVAAGEPLVTIDDRDYALEVERLEARLAMARAALEIERGQQAVAKSEWALIGKEIPADAASRSLALREPQLAQARAGLAEAESTLGRARLDAERTTLNAPFNGVVITESVDPGDVVSTGQELARIAGSDRFWIDLQVSQADARRLISVLRQAPEGTLPAVVEVGGGVRAGRLISVKQDVSAESRLATAIVSVADPLLLAGGAAGAPLLIGAYVGVRIDAGAIDGVYAIPRTALHENDTIWVRDGDGRLAIRTIEPIRMQGDVVLARAAVEPGDALVLDRIARAVPGMALATPADALATAAEAPTDTRPDGRPDSRPGGEHGGGRGRSE